MLPSKMYMKNQPFPQKSYFPKKNVTYFFDSDVNRKEDLPNISSFDKYFQNMGPQSFAKSLKHPKLASPPHKKPPTTSKFSDIDG